MIRGRHHQVESRSEEFEGMNDFSYCFSLFDDDEEASRMLSAAYSNDVQTLIPLLESNSSTWFERAIERQYGFNLLQIAILRNSDDVFDYLMSLDRHNLLSLIEAEDFAGSTALVVALSYRSSIRIGGGDHPSERYAYELIRKGANINKKSRRGRCMLLCALENKFLSTARCLIEQGANMNTIVPDGPFMGYTLLQLSCYVFDDDDDTSVEAITMLLINGADPTIGSSNGDTVFDILCRESDNRDLHVALQNVFLFAFDELTLCVVNYESLLKLAENNSPIFFELLKLNPKIIFGGRCCGDDEYPPMGLYSLYPLMIDIKYLSALLKDFPVVVKILLNNYSPRFSRIYRTFDIRNIEMLMQSSSLYWDTMELISNLCCRTILSWCLHAVAFFDVHSLGFHLDSTTLSRMTNDEFREKVLPMIYYLCSYGMTIDVRDLRPICKMTGFTEDFKNLVFMLGDDDVDDSAPIVHHRLMTDLIPRIFYDVTLDIHEMVENRSLCIFINWEQMFQYFVHPKIKNAYAECTIAWEEHVQQCSSCITKKLLAGVDIALIRSSPLQPDDHVVNSYDLKLLPRVPLLQELSRDAFRKYFIKRFNITGAKQFHSLIKLLPISHVHRKIITFETELYNNYTAVMGQEVHYFVGLLQKSIKSSVLNSLKLNTQS